MSMTKRNRKRTVAAILAIVLVAVLSAGGTLAYLSFQRQTRANTFEDANDARVKVLLTQTSWDNSQVERFNSGTDEDQSWLYRMATTEYSLYGSNDTDRDADNAFKTPYYTLLQPRSAADEQHYYDFYYDIDEDLEEPYTRAEARGMLEEVRGISYLETYTFSGANALLKRNIVTKMQEIGTTAIEGGEAQKISDLGIWKSVDLEAGAFVPKNPRVHNASSVSDAYVAVRIAFATGNSSANVNKIGDVPIVNDDTAKQILGGLVFTNGTEATASTALASGESLGINPSSDWVADKGNGSYDGVYYFYYRTPLAKSPDPTSASSVPTATSPLFNGFYIVSDAGRADWTGSWSSTSGAFAPAPTVVGNQGNFLDFLLSEEGMNGHVEVIVDAAGIQTAGLAPDSGSLSEGTARLDGSADGAVETALRNVFGEVVAGS